MTHSESPTPPYPTFSPEEEIERTLGKLTRLARDSAVKNLKKQFDLIDPVIQSKVLLRLVELGWVGALRKAIEVSQRYHCKIDDALNCSIKKNDPALIEEFLFLYQHQGEAISKGFEKVIEMDNPDLIEVFLDIPGKKKLEHFLHFAIEKRSIHAIGALFPKVKNPMELKTYLHWMLADEYTDGLLLFHQKVDPKVRLDLLRGSIRKQNKAIIKELVGGLSLDLTGRELLCRKAVQFYESQSEKFEPFIQILDENLDTLEVFGDFLKEETESLSGQAVLSWIEQRHFQKNLNKEDHSTSLLRIPTPRL